MKSAQAKGWLLTYPKCPLTKEEVLESLRGTGTIVEYVICEEKHQDGSPHCHAFIKYDKRTRFAPHKWDLYIGSEIYHGNYQVAKSWKACSAYVKKDGNYISNINVENAQKHKSKGIQLEHMDMDPLDLLESGILPPMSLPSFLKSQQAYQLLKRKRDMLRQDDENENREKKRHVWIYGESNVGKSEKLREFIKEKGVENCFQMPPNNDWTGYTNERYLYYDEYKGQITIQDLNRICDGGAKMNTKGGTTQLINYPIVIIVSNFDIASCYHKAGIEQINTLMNRFELIKYEKDY